jgi:adenine-specific DNA-methyltransferase
MPSVVIDNPVLKRALKAEIDESAWSALYSTNSRPFDRPKTGRIAVKVINHYGDEVSKVFCLTPNSGPEL